MNFDVESRLVLKALSGSHAYGTAVEDSDEDYRGIVIAPKSYYLGLDRFEQYETKDPDLVYFDIHKFIKLALKANPNILELLYMPSYKIRTAAGMKLITLRKYFLTKRCATTYAGYATAQLKKLRTKPAPASRTERRMALVERYGYDTKFAMHLIRLLRTGKEILEEGTIRVRRPDAAQLLDIRNGKYTLDELEEIAEVLFHELKHAEDKTKLPSKPPYSIVNTAVVEIVEDFLKGD